MRVGAPHGDQPIDPYRASPPPALAPHPALAEQPWRISTLTRSLGAQLFIGVFAALVIGAFVHGGDPNQEGGGSAADALLSPLSMLLGLGVAGLVLAVNYLQAGTLEGTSAWIRRVKPAPPIEIGVHEITRVERTRGLKVRNQYGTVREARTMSFKIFTRDGRKISVPEAAVFRQPRLLQFYDAAMKAAFIAVGEQLSAGIPLSAGDVALYHDRLVWTSGAQIALREIGKVQVVVGETATVRAFDRMGRSVGALPDDELLLRALIVLGVSVDEQRAAS